MVMMVDENHKSSQLKNDMTPQTSRVVRTSEKLRVPTKVQSTKNIPKLYIQRKHTKTMNQNIYHSEVQNPMVDVGISDKTNPKFSLRNE